MRVWVVYLLLCGCALAEEEVLDDDTFNTLTEDLMREIRKRISEDSLLSDPAQSCEDSYGLSTSMDTIIMTHDSIENGAEFIQAPVVDSGRECMQECCDDDNCNVAVFKDKELSNSCYLFDCGNPGTCLYANHTGFTVLHLPNKKTAKVKGNDHEEDLVKLVTTTLPTTTTTVSKTTTKAENQDQSVPLFGECSADKDCAGSKTVCQVNYCICKDGYHAQEGECRKDCSRFEFQCANNGQPLSYPQCVALYDTCDGIEHCSDGSDERDCSPPDSSPDLSLGQNPAMPPYLPPNQQQAYADLQRQQLQGYMQQPVQPQQQQLSLQQQIQSLPLQQLPQQQQQLQPGYTNPLLPQQQQQQQQPVYNPVNPLQQQLQPQPVYQPVQQQPLPVQQQQPQQLQQPQQAYPSQVQPQQPAYQGQTVQGQQMVAPPQQQPVPPSRQQGQQQLQQPVPAVQNQNPAGEQYSNFQPDGRPHQVNRKPGPAYEAQRPPNRPGDAGHGRPDVDGTPRLAQQGTGQSKIQDTDPGNQGNNQADRMGSQAIKAEVQPLPRADTDGKQPNTPEQAPDTASTDQVSKSQGQATGTKTKADQGLTPPSAASVSGDNRGGNRGKLPPDNHAGGYTDGGYIRGNYQYNNYPSNQFGGQTRTGGWENGQPATQFRSDPRNYKPAGYHGHYNNDYDNYDYGGGAAYGGGFGPDYAYYNSDSGYPGYGRGPHRNPPASSWDLRKAYLNLWNEPPKSSEASEKEDSDEQEAGWDDNDSQYKTHEEDQTSEDSNEGESQPSSKPDHLQTGGDDNDSAEKVKPKKNKPEKTKADPIIKTSAEPDQAPTKQGGSQPSSSEETPSKPAPKPADTADHSDAKVEPLRGDLQVNKEEQPQDGEPTSVQSNEGAVIALALGLSVTALLLVFVGCRLRSVKRRLRRGRPLSSNEADYLVNGMYL